MGGCIPLILSPGSAPGHKLQKSSKECGIFQSLKGAWHNAPPLNALRAGGRAVDVGGPSVYQRGAKFKIKHKSRCLQKSKLFNWGAWPPMVPALNTLAIALHLFRDMVMIGKESTVAFGAIDKLVALL